ncbi:hypothetical protein niasHT_019117 [Heterodera trifolii]|uniref:Uncharacterized protein n=1 Tax=Heterodera trifolii TaxID=157864 RepID=A0ABD2KZB2_9BILA
MRLERTAERSHHSLRSNQTNISALTHATTSREPIELAKSFRMIPSLLNSVKKEKSYDALNLAGTELAGRNWPVPTTSSLAQSKNFTLYAYNGQKCIVHAYGTTLLDMPLSAVAMAECRTFRLFDHVNLNRFLGLSLDGPNVLAVWNFCARGRSKM